MPEQTIISPQSQTTPAAVTSVLSPSVEPEKPDMPVEVLRRLPLQRKLTVGAADDPLEQEADEMARKVMRKSSPSFMQNKDQDGESSGLQRQPVGSYIQKRVNGKTEHVSESVSNRISSEKGIGHPLPHTEKSFMENRFGRDFTNVVLHTGISAVKLSTELNAKAFTTGSDIYFNEGQYQPESMDGRSLLAHELTHVVQQETQSNKLIQRKCIEGPPAEDEVEYITGSGKSKMAYDFSDKGGANAFIKKNPDENLICHPKAKGGKTVYAIYQKAKPKAESTDETKYPYLTGAELDIDLTGNVTSKKELHLSFNPSGNNIKITFSHITGARRQTVSIIPDNIEVKNSRLLLTGSDGIHPLQILVIGFSKTNKAESDVYVIEISPDIIPGKYSFNAGSEKYRDEPFKNKPIIIDLAVPASFSDAGTSIIEEQDFKNEGPTWRFNYKVGPKKQIDASFFMIKDPDHEESAICFFSMSKSDSDRGVQSNTSRKMAIPLPGAYEDIVISNEGTINNAVLYGITLMHPLNGDINEKFMITYEMIAYGNDSLDVSNAYHGLNIYTLGIVNNVPKQITPLAHSQFELEKNIWQVGHHKRTVDSFRIETAKHAFDKLPEITLPENEIASLQDEMSLIIMMAVKEKLSAPETFSQWMEFSYGVVVFGQAAVQGDESAKNWLSNKGDVFINSLVKDVGRKGDISSSMDTFKANMGYESYLGVSKIPVKNKYTSESYVIRESITDLYGESIGAKSAPTIIHQAGPFEAAKSFIRSGQYEKAVVSLRSSYYLWVEDQLIKNSSTDKATLEKFKAFGYQLSYRRQLRQRLTEAKQPLQKVKAIYYPDLGNIKDETGSSKYVSSTIISIPLDIYYQDDGDEWVIYNFTTLTKPGAINDFKRTWTKQYYEVRPPEEMFDTLSYDEGLGDGYISYKTKEDESGIVRVNHPWTLGGVLLTVGAVVGLIALALTGVGLIAEGALATGIIATAATLADIAAITVAVGASVKLGQDYSQGMDITAGRIAEAGLDITTAVLPAIRSLRTIASLKRYKGLYILMDDYANSRVLAKLSAGANITAMVVTSAKGAEELAELSKALNEGRIDEATFYWAVFRNVSFGVINILLLHQDIKTLSGRGLGNTNIDEVIEKGFKRNILEVKPDSMYSRESLEAGITIMQESSSVYRIAVLEALGTEKNFEGALEILCYLGKKGRGAIDDVVLINGRVRRAVDVMAEAKLFGKVLSIPQGFTGSKGEALDTVSRDFTVFSKKLSDGVKAVPGLNNAEIHIEGSAVMGVARPKPDPAAAIDVTPAPGTGSPKPTTEATPKWDVDIGIMIESGDFSNTIAGVYQGKAKMRGTKGAVDLELTTKSPQERITIANDIQAEDAIYQAAKKTAEADGGKVADNRKFNSQARGFANGILTGKANMSSEYFPELAALKDTLVKEFSIPKLDLSIIAKGSGFDSSTFISVP